MSQPPVSQANSKYLSIVAENGEQFNPGQKIIFNLEENLGFIKKDSYLVFDVLNNSADNSRACFGEAGANGLIKSLRIYSKKSGVLLEQLENFNKWCSIENQYLYDDREQLRIKEGVGKPTKAFQVKSDGVNVDNYFQVSDIENTLLSPVNLNQAANLQAEPAYESKRYCIPLRCGVFRYWDDEKLIPVMNMGGLRIELILAPAVEVLSRVAGSYKSVAKTGDTILNEPAENGNFPADLINVGISIDNNAVGSTTITLTPIPADAPSGFDSAGAALNAQQPYMSALCVGNSISIEGGAGGTQNVSITAMALSGNKITITHGGAADTYAGNNGILKVLATTKLNYKITNTEMRLLQVAPSPEMAKVMGESINYEFTSYDLFLDNIPTAALRHQIPINSVASKAKAVFSVIHDSRTADYQYNNGYYTGSNPTENLINEVVYFINNRLYPLSSYNPDTHGDRALTLNELQKAFSAIGKNVLSLGNNEASNLNDYNQTFLLARELARNQFVFDLRDAEPEVRLGFSAVRPAVLNVNTFVFSKKVIMSQPGGQVIVSL